MSKHTPGPWKAVEHQSISGNDYITIKSGSWDIAHSKYSANDWETERANAQLIAQAPALLEAAQAVMRFFPPAKWNHNCLDDLSRAICKAQGLKVKFLDGGE